MAESKNGEYRWGMVVDLDLCTGCGACVTACYAENNVPVVGEEEFILGRALPWLKIERHWKGDYPHLRADFVPMMCNHCQAAPCEPVCPMYATVHDQNDQINVQVYNRCAGIRYCGVNCPYKVRVFNWFNPYFPEPLNEQLNPDVTVRKRGIMEKCTFCIQRIRRARDESNAKAMPMHDGDVQPACVQTCPTEALVFGNLNDPESMVSELARSPRAFKLLEDLGTGPSISYLKRGASHVG
jgi:molybdopterin-containing oxidoreductase family iron-sulfur binding subunit